MEKHKFGLYELNRVSASFGMRNVFVGLGAERKGGDRFEAMEAMSPSSSSSASARMEASTFDEQSMHQSLHFSDSLMDLKNLRSQLYSAAEYFELSYTNDDQKQMVVNTLKDYAVKALVNTVDHLGSVSYKVNGLLDEKVDEVSGTEFRFSCIEQRIRTCQEYIDREGLAQQSLVITAPKYHRRYIIPGNR
ncbi:protein ABIL3-like [Iris pallida]|uniref:Protein ABIL3-like n=1 Tax=Iris pallida TaxID=29817 RepID=A0AAX6IDC7_IRIPA|nr:protein ABIL3-like [Iris pallida]